MVRCAACNYANNADDAFVCNLCGQVLRAKRSTGAFPVGGPAAAKATASGRLGGAGATSAPPRDRATETRARHVLQLVGGVVRELVQGEPLRIGRAPYLELPIPSSRVSRQHAEIVWEDGRPVLVDKGSSNGTFVGGVRIERRQLEPGDEIEIGPFFCTYALDRGGPLRAPEADALEEEGGSTRAMSAPSAILSGAVAPGIVAEVLQSIELNRKTGTLGVQGRVTGWIAISEGTPLAAVAGDARDEEAVMALVLSTSGQFSLMPGLLAEERRMTASITAILLELSRRQDEQTTLDGALPPPEGYEDTTF